MQALEFPLAEASFNLALEETLFENLPLHHPGYFILWQNRPSVIIGRNQICQQSVNLYYARTQAIPVLRRNTGGGAVYHDEGNLNFTFIEWLSRPDPRPIQSCLKRVAGALASFGIAAEISGRNDLEINGKKFSGSSLLRKKGKVLHHGTLLIQSDLERLNKILKVEEGKYTSRAVSSVRARVLNLGDLLPLGVEAFKEALFSACASEKGTLSGDILAKAKILAQKKYESNEWNVGKSSACSLKKSRRFRWGELLLLLKLKGGIIASCALRGDFINLQELDQLEKSFVNCPFTPEAMAGFCASIAWERYISGCDKMELVDFMSRGLFE